MNSMKHIPERGNAFDHLKVFKSNSERYALTSSQRDKLAERFRSRIVMFSPKHNGGYIMDEMGVFAFLGKNFLKIYSPEECPSNWNDHEREREDLNRNYLDVTVH